MFDRYKELKCEKCNCISKQNTTTGSMYEDDNGIFFVFTSAICPNCGNRYNHDRAESATKKGVLCKS